MTDRPTTEPRTEAGRDLLRRGAAFNGGKHKSITLRVDDWVPAILALEAEAAQGAAPRAEGLDVERLARALHVNVGDRMDYEICPQTLDGWHRKTAEIIAAEYARLGGEAGERTAGEGA